MTAERTLMKIFADDIEGIRAAAQTDRIARLAGIPGQAEPRGLCAEAVYAAFGLKTDAGKIKLTDMSGFLKRDAEFAAARGYACVLLCRAGYDGETLTAYAEPTFVTAGANSGWLRSGGFMLDCVPAADGRPEAPETVCASDDSAEVHPYYIRFSGDSRGWLDIVTSERADGAIITKPVSVKAAHNWLGCALEYDPGAFIAGITD